MEGHGVNFLIDFIRETAAVLLNAGPFLLLGFFLAGLLRVFVPARWLAKTIGKNDLRSVTISSLVGIPLPLCSCSVLPTAAALRKSGASKGATVSFLVSTPETGIDSISVTYALMDPIMTVARPLAAMATALAAGAAVNVAVRPSEEGQSPEPETGSESGEGPTESSPIHARGQGPGDNAGSETPPHSSCHDDLTGAEETSSEEATAEKIPAPLEVHMPRPRARGLRERLLEAARFGYVELLDDIVAWFIVGVLATGFIAAVVPEGALEAGGAGGFTAMLAMLLIGIPLYVCATSSTPVAAALILKGLNPGAALVFLLAGPATNMASLSVLLKLLGKRVVAIYLVAVAVFSLLAGLLVDAVYRAADVDAAAAAGTGQEMVPAWIKVPAALVLLGLIISSARRADVLGRYRRWLASIGKPLGLDLGSKGAVAFYAVVVIVLYVLTGFSIVQPGETGWVVTFGRVTRTIEDPGLVVHWPYPFSHLETERTDLVRSINRGFRPGQSSFAFDRLGLTPLQAQLGKEAEVATGDENLLALRYSIQYKVADPYKFHFGAEQPDSLVAALGEYAIRRVVCQMETDSILVNHRIEIEQAIAETLKAQISAVGCGVKVLRVDLVDVHAPPEVHFAFRDVASAMEDNHRFVRQAESYRNEALASARGEFYRTIVEAGNDSLLRVSTALGDSIAFAALEAATRDTRRITMLRMYLDAAAEALASSRVVAAAAEVPVDLWLTGGGEPGLWSEPAGLGSSSGSSVPRGTSAATPDRSNTGTTGRGSQETWREKLRRLEESRRQGLGGSQR